MRDLLVGLVGESFASIASVIVSAAIVIVLALVLIRLGQKFLAGRLGRGIQARAPRLAVMDVAGIDQKRKLVLVRRDEVEHLILVGGESDLVVEAGIIRAPAALRATSREPGFWPEADSGRPGNEDETKARPEPKRDLPPVAASAPSQGVVASPVEPGAVPQAVRRPNAPAKAPAARAANPSTPELPGPAKPAQAPQLNTNGERVVPISPLRPSAQPRNPAPAASPVRREPVMESAPRTAAPEVRPEAPPRRTAEPARPSVAPAVAPPTSPRSLATPTYPRSEDAPSRAAPAGTDKTVAAAMEERKALGADMNRSQANEGKSVADAARRAPAQMPAPAAPAEQTHAEAGQRSQRQQEAAKESSLEDILAAELADSFDSAARPKITSPQPAPQSQPAQPRPVEAPKASETSSASTRPEPESRTAERRRTIEEEMERLLGDLSFETRPDGSR